MSLYVPEGTPPLISNTVARIERRLPQPGEVLVRAGQRVEPDEVVARAYVPARPQIMNVARALSIEPAAVERAMKREVGNKINQGDLLARATPIGGRALRAPISGIITAVDTATGYVTITPDPVTHELQATVRGLVMDVMPGRGVRIETPASQVYGAFGIGPERSGVLHLLVTDPSEEITPDMIDARSSYAILIGGSSISAAALRRAVAEQVRGVIVGGIDASELATFLGWSAQDLWQIGSRGWQAPQLGEKPYDLTLVVTEGFGHHPMASALFEKLAEHDRQDALIEGETHLRFSHHRPRVVIPLSSRTPNLQLEASRLNIYPGSTVRLLTESQLGMIGQVRAVWATPRRLASRIRTPAADVVLEDGTTVVVPMSALEALR